MNCYNECLTLGKGRVGFGVFRKFAGRVGESVDLPRFPDPLLVIRLIHCLRHKSQPA